MLLSGCLFRWSVSKHRQIVNKLALLVVYLAAAGMVGGPTPARSWRRAPLTRV